MSNMQIQSCDVPFSNDLEKVSKVMHTNINKRFKIYAILKPNFKDFSFFFFYPLIKRS